MKPPLESWLIPIVVLAALAWSCGPKKQPESKQAVAAGSASADVGDWESALVQYKTAASSAPDDASVKKKLIEAQHKVSEIRTKRAEDANAAGQIGDAGDLWRQAIELLPEEERRSCQAWADVESNLS